MRVVHSHFMVNRHALAKMQAGQEKSGQGQVISVTRLHNTKPEQTGK
jgi:hypothetical protein